MTLRSKVLPQKISVAAKTLVTSNVKHVIERTIDIPKVNPKEKLQHKPQSTSKKPNTSKARVRIKLASMKPVTCGAPPVGFALCRI